MLTQYIHQLNKTRTNPRVSFVRMTDTLYNRNVT